MCTKNHDRVSRIKEVMAMDWPHTSSYGSLGFCHFEYVVKNIDLIMLIIRVTKANMDSFKKNKAYRGPQTAQNRRRYRQFLEKIFGRYLREGWSYS